MALFRNRYEYLLMFVLMKTKNLILFVALLFALSYNLHSQYIANEDEGDYFIRNIYIERDSVFMKSDRDWFWGANILNSLHFLTREHIIEDELLFNLESMTVEKYLAETERNLRKTNLFVSVDIRLDSIAEGTSDAYVVTKDRWSLYPSLLVGLSGGNYRLGGRLEEYNLFGRGADLMAEALYLQKNDIGWQGRAKFEKARLFRSNIGMRAVIEANKFYHSDTLDISKQYRTLETPSSFGISVINNMGDKFHYKGNGLFDTMNLTEQRAHIFYSHGWERQNRYFATAMLEAENIERPSEEYARAFDNCGRFLMQFSSTAHYYAKIKNVNSYNVQDIESGGYGRVIIGQVFPMRSSSNPENRLGESIYYVAGEGEQSYYKDDLYLFVSIKGSSGFQRGLAKYTYQEANITAMYKFNDMFLIGARIKQQSVWNWFDKDRQLLLDEDHGLRGYAAHELVGANRYIANFEARFFPDWHIWTIDFSGVAFCDVGNVWDYTMKYMFNDVYVSAGLGLRGHFSKSNNPHHTFRLDVAYNFHENKIGTIMFGSQQYFDFFFKHDYRKPTIFGLEYDDI